MTASAFKRVFIIAFLSKFLSHKEKHAAKKARKKEMDIRPSGIIVAETKKLKIANKRIGIGAHLFIIPLRKISVISAPIESR